MTRIARSPEPVKSSALHAEQNCTWTLDMEDWNAWRRTCSTTGDLFTFNEGGPCENGFVFCPSCGRPLTEERLPRRPE